MNTSGTVEHPVLAVEVMMVWWPIWIGCECIEPAHRGSDLAESSAMAAVKLLNVEPIS